MDIDQPSVDVYRNFLQELSWDPVPGHQAFVTKHMQHAVNSVIKPLKDRTEWQTENESKITNHIREINERGYTCLGPLLTSQEVDETVAAAKQRPVFNSHVYRDSNRQPFSIDELRSSSNFGCYRLDDLLRLPHLLEIANSKEVLRIAEGFLGATPTIYQMNGMWSFAGRQSTSNVAQTFHRDFESLKFLALFVYLTDVTDDSGPHYLIEGSHSREAIMNDLRRTLTIGKESTLKQKLRLWLKREVKLTEVTDLLYYGNGYEKDDIFHHYLGHKIRKLTGPKGYAFLSNAFCVHKGALPIKSDRLLFWSRYGLYENKSNTMGVSDKLPIALDNVKERIGDDPAVRYINRSILSF